MKLNIHLPCDPAIPLQEKYAKTYMQMLVTAVFGNNSDVYQ